MKRWTAMLLSLSLIIGLSACGQQAVPSSVSSQPSSIVVKEPEAPPPLSTSSPEGESEPVSDTAPAEPEGAAEEHILIAYFTWAENTVVEDQQSAIQGALSHYESVGDTADYGGVDAVSSASVVPPGNAAKLAGWIHQRVGGDLFSIIVAEPYSSDYDECLDRAAGEKAANARPALADHVENMEDYDIIFLGFPNWWYTLPMAIHSFLEEYDFSGKTVIPFCTHGTGGLAGTIRDLTAALPDSATVLEPIGVYRPEVDSSQGVVNQWLDSLGFDETSPEGQAEESSEEKTAAGERRFRLVAEGKEIYGSLYDTPAAHDLWESMPLELSFEDYNGTEKIAYLPSPLTTQGEPDSFDPSPGDLCYYAPWGNICIFYRDFRNSSSLVSLGKLDSDIQWLAGQSGDFKMTMERAAP